MTDTIVDKVTQACKRGKRRRAYLGHAVDVRPLRSFVVGNDGTLDGATADLAVATADDQRLDDDVTCLVEIPATHKTVKRGPLRSTKR